jgi:hypothetical protein
MSVYLMPEEVFKKLRKESSILETIDYISSAAGISFKSFDETHIHFDVIDSKKLLIFLLKV